MLPSLKAKLNAWVGKNLTSKQSENGLRAGPAVVSVLCARGLSRRWRHRDGGWRRRRQGTACVCVLGECCVLAAAAAAAADRTQFGQLPRHSEETPCSRQTLPKQSIAPGRWRGSQSDKIRQDPSAVSAARHRGKGVCACVCGVNRIEHGDARHVRRQGKHTHPSTA